VSLVWFIYNFSAYSFNIYSSSWLSVILGDSAPLWKIFAWSCLTNVFYLPGSFFGAWVSDWIGPRACLALGVALQGIVGFIMSGCYGFLATAKNVAAFVVVYG
jgi:MFS family permease